ncbi:protein of unknown function [Taphrina deformans PYCC 5710]|uniref:AB hydrolase-1 domain-containing protein n=1 Tax=Taphrina deformans (strain PYCC 5710 / ATCC 11124 / CBS 356.35 / IMI 108563 / JCM 9778 / NBRC 8474) TaxID=1097556 RepID=R4XGR8_TAPDE|nr:protein of unknown function [Taphrina deformans PYCC 5710]|eukprot:CCG84864.1 protein of unknown function [Taphrina deformans PYCC 5710]
MLIKQPFEFQASFPRRLLRSTQHSTDRLTCLGTKYALQSSVAAVALTSDAVTFAPVSSDTSATKSSSEQPIKVNIVLAHANGFVKELYEPLIQEVLQARAEVQAVFVHDVATQGASGLKNAKKLGDQYSWSDSGLDILCMINSLRARGIMDDNPIVGVGHSMGGAQIAYASLLHPNMFAATILIEPILPDFRTDIQGATAVAAMSARRRETWNSKEEARKAFLKSPFYQVWHPAVFERWMDHGIVLTGNGTEVKLATTPSQEVFSFMHMMPFQDTVDTDPDACTYVRSHMHTLNHPVFLIFGEKSTAITPQRKREISALARFSTSIDLKDHGHLIPMESPAVIANLILEYIDQTLKGLRVKAQEDRSLVRGSTMTPQFKDELANILKQAKEKAKL